MPNPDAYKDIALQLSLKVLDKLDISKEEAKTLPYEIYNSIYQNLDKTMYA